MFKLEDKLDVKFAKQLSSVTLAFIGDAVHSLFAREKLVFLKDDKGATLNKKTAEMVKASAQAEFLDKIYSVLTEEEIDVYKRARNAKKGTRAKNASVGVYNKATGFEAVIGFLYITGNIQRLNFLLNYEEEEIKNEN
ncbi:MAG: Mini-ribonuclease 3 [Clostridia bacterium]|nr:Mini-ribonuclease 3 [Clostridia bacterium]